MACRLVIKDPILKSLLGNDTFQNLQEFQDKVYEVFVLEGTPFPTESIIKLASGNIFRPTKFGRIISLDGDSLMVTISIPQDENVDNFRYNIKTDPNANVVYEDHGIIINPIQDGVGTRPDLDTLTTLWLGNFFTVNSNKDLLYRLNTSFPKLFADFIDQAHNHANRVTTGLNKSVIEKAVEIYRLYEKVASDRKLALNPIQDVEPLINQVLNLVKDTTPEGKDKPDIPKYDSYTTKEDARSIADQKEIEKYEQETNQVTPLVSNVSFLHSDLKNPIPADTDLGENIPLARTILLGSIKESKGEFRVRVTKGQADMVQPRIPGRWLTEQEVLGKDQPSVVGIVEQKINGVWKPVYLKGNGDITIANYGKSNFEITTDPNEAKSFKYNVGENEYTSSQLYLQVNPDVRKTFLDGVKNDPNYQQIHIVKGVDVSTKYITLNETGIPLDRVYIASKGGTRGIARILTDDTDHFEYPEIQGLNEKEIQEIIPLLEHTYTNQDDLEKAIIYLNKLISIGEFNTIEGQIFPAEKTKSLDYAITKRIISFYPSENKKNIKVVVERIKVGDGYTTNTNQTPVTFEQNPELVLNGLRTARVNIPKSTEDNSNQIGTYGNKVVLKDDRVKVESWPIEDQHKWLGDKIKTRLKMIDGKVINPHLSLVVYKESLAVTKPKVNPNEFNIGGWVITKGKVIDGKTFRTNLIQRGTIDKNSYLWNLYESINSDLSSEVIFLSDKDIQAELGDYSRIPLAVYGHEGQIFLNFEHFKNPANQKDLLKFFIEESLHEVTSHELGKESVINTEEYQRLQDVRSKLLLVRQDYLNSLREQDRDLASQQVDYYLQSIEEFATSPAVGRMVHFMEWASDKIEWEKTKDKDLIDHVIGLLKKILAKFLSNKNLNKQVISDVLRVAYKKTTPIQDQEKIEEVIPPVIDMVMPPEIENRAEDVQLDDDFLKELDKFSGVVKKGRGSFSPQDNTIPIKYLDVLAAKVLFENRSEDNATFGDFIQGNVVSGTLWGGMLKAIADEFRSEGTTKERKFYIKNLIDNRNTILAEWQTKSKLFKFTDDRVVFNEDGIEESGDTQKKDLQNSNEENSKFADRTEQKLSSLESGDRLAQIFVRMTPKVAVDENNNPTGELDKDPNGNFIPADYTSLWNSIADITAGSLTIEEMIAKMKGANKMWEIRVVAERLESLSDSIQDTMVRNGFQRSFSKYLVPTIIVTVNKSEEGADYTYQNSGRLDSMKIESSLSQAFREFAEDNDFLVDYWVNIEGSSKTITGINFNKLLAKIDSIQKGSTTSRYSFNQSSLIEFWKEIGMMIPDIAAKKTEFTDALDNLTKKLRDKVYQVTVINQKSTSDDLRITMSDLNLIEFIKKDQTYTTNGASGVLAGEPGLVRDLTDILSNYLPFTTSNMTKNAESENQSNLHNFSSWLINIKFLNEKNFGKVWRLENPIARFSLIRRLIDSGKKITPVNLSGTVITDADGNKNGTNTIGLNTIDYLKQEFFTLLTKGVKENIRAETANSSFGFEIDYGNKQKLPIETNKFKTNAYLDSLYNIFRDYLTGEIERIQAERESNFEYYPKYNKIREDFSLFKNILTQDSKNIILNNIDDIELSPKDIIDLIDLKGELERFFIKEEVEDFKDYLFQETGITIDKNHPIFEGVQKEISANGLNAVIASFITNGFIISTEEVILFHGELGMFDKFYKRSKSNISNGTPVIINQGSRNLLQQEGNTFTETSIGKIPDYYNGSIAKSLVTKDDNKVIDNPEEFIKAVQESLEQTGKIFGKEVPENAGRKKVQKYLEGSEVSDGDGWIHPDAYRMFLIGVNSWSVEQEEGFKYLVYKDRKEKGNILTEDQQVHIDKVERLIKEKGHYFQFPKIKFQYRGGSRAIGEQPVSNIEMLDKFALTPLFPEMIKGKVAEPIFDQMTKEGHAYGKFSTGTKIGTYQVDNLLDMVRTGQPVVINSTHEVLLDFMKEQVKTSNKLKVKNIFGVQVRKLIISNLSVDGYIMGNLTKWVNQWKSGQRNLANNERNKLIEELGGDPNSPTPTIDKQKFVDLLNEELAKRELPKAFTDIFENFKEDDNFEEALSPQIIETLLYSVLKNRIVKAKFPGGQLVQISSSLFDSIEGRDLEFYRVVNGKVLPADCKVTLSGDFLNLLNLKEVQELVLTGVDSLDALNQLLKQDTFRQKYAKQLTLFSYRIPTQGYNSMDIFMVKEFLPPYMSNSIVLPPEIVTKSGTDYDYDKASVVLPSISRSGQFIEERNSESIGKQYDKIYSQLEEQFKILNSEEFKASLRLFGETNPDEVDINEFVESRLVKDGQLITRPEFIKQIQDGIRNKVSYNQVIESAQGILLDPINFARLVTPNSTDIIRPAIEKILNALGLKQTEYRDTKIISYLSSLKKWQAVKIKDLLGIGAVNNTFYTLMQEANLKLNDTLMINGTEFDFTIPLLSKKEQSKVSLADPYIIGSNIDKLEIINQFINLTVDAASDDIAGYTNLIRDNTGFVLFQIMLGVPLERIFNLIHQPIVYKYHQIINEELSNGLSSGDAKKIAYQKLFGFESTKEVKGILKDKNQSDYWEDISQIEIPEHFGSLNIVPRNKVNTYKLKASDRSILAYYLQGIEQANALRQAQSYLNFDTFTSPSYLFSAQRETIINDIRETGLFNLDGIDRIKKDSVISHLEIHDIFKLLSENLFSFKRDEQYVNEAVRLANEVYDNKDSFLRVFDNDFLMFVTQNFGNKKDVDDVKKLLIGGQLIKEWNRLKKKYPQLENYSIGKKLIANFSRETEFTNPQFFMGLDQDPEEYDQIADEIREMLNGANVDFKMFASNLIKVGFYQTGFNQSPVYLMKALPFEEVRKFLKPAYDNYLKLNNQQRAQVISEFERDFLVKRSRQFGKYFIQEYRDLGIDYDTLKKTAIKEPWRFLDYRRSLKLDIKQSPIVITRTYTGKITTLKENQVFVFGSNPIGVNGNITNNTGGAALVATKNGWVEQGEKMDNKLSKSGKAWGLTTVESPGKKRSKTSAQIKEGVQKLYDYALKNPNKEFLVAYTGKTGTNLNGYSNQELSDIFSSLPIPLNIIFESAFATLLTKNKVQGEEISSYKDGLVLTPNTFTNHSGGAIGSDIAWDTIGKEFGVVNHIHYWMTNKTPHGNKEITAKDKDEGQKKVTTAAREMGRIESTHQVRDERLIRNWSQVKYSDAVFAITTLLNVGDKMNHDKKALIIQGKGGTGYAIQMAVNEGKPVYVFDQIKKQWYSINKIGLTKIDTPILTPNFAGIGTREINDAGRQAIKDVYTKTFTLLTDQKRNISQQEQPSSIDNEEESTKQDFNQVRVRQKYLETPRSYQKQSFINDNLKESEFGIRDLAARLSARIGSEGTFSADQTKDYAGWSASNQWEINLAKATLDTPIHEIVGHPIIRSIKNSNVGLYQSLLKELETNPYAKEVLDRVKKEYNVKNTDVYRIVVDTLEKNGKPVLESDKGVSSIEKYMNNLPNSNRLSVGTWNIDNKYTLEEQQEEALVQLLGELTAGKIKETKENKNLISLLKQLLKEMTVYMRSLFNSKEIEIDKLSADMTLNDLSNLLAYTNSKIILPGNIVEYTTPDNSRFFTYQEASNHVSKLFKDSKDIDLSNVELEKPFDFKGLKDPISLKTIKNVVYQQGDSGRFMADENQWEPSEPSIFFITFEDNSIERYYIEDLLHNNGETLAFYSKAMPIETTIESFIKENKPFEQSKEIIETWKKENNIVYNPEEVYSRGQGFYSAIGAYSTLELDVLLQNLLHHIEDNKKAGGEFNISAYTKPIDKKIQHLEEESNIRFVIYPKSEDIKWAAPTDVYSGSVWDAESKVSKTKKSELLGVTYTKYPALKNVDEISPNLADIIDKRSHHHNELGIELTNTNFRLEFDSTVPFEIKKLVNSVNSILDERYGKIVKPETSKENQNQENFVNLKIRLKELNEQESDLYATTDYDSISIDDAERIRLAKENVENQIKQLQGSDTGIQPTQTRSNTTSIESVKDKIDRNKYDIINTSISKKTYEDAIEKSYKDSNNIIGELTEDGETYYVDVNDNLRYRRDKLGYFAENVNRKEKEYTEQALINTRIAKLKEVSKKYPRSLITSKVINDSLSERQYQQSKPLSKNQSPVFLFDQPIVDQEEKDVNDCNSHIGIDDIPF